jgi:hypothetical protein
MTSRKRTAVIAAALLGAVAAPARAQLNSMPVFFSPKGGTGIVLYGDFGKGLNDESGKNTAWAARGVLGIGPVSAGGAVGTVNPEVDGQRQNAFQWMAMAAFRLLGGGPLPLAVNVQTGYGRLAPSDTTSEVNVPVGLGVSLNAPTPGLSLEVWAAPRFTVRRVKVGDATETQTGFGLSAGVSAGFSSGLGGYVAVDWLSLSDESGGDFPLIGRSPAILGVGLSLSLKLPGGL